MPTGYTSKIADGIGFKDFALSCARAFGACIEMRDDPSDKPIPNEFKPNDYHKKRMAAAKLAGHPGVFDADIMLRSTTLFEFDDAVTAPLHGFAGAHDYYFRSSSRHFLHGIRRPTLLLSSFDDPFLPPDVLHDVAVLAHDNSFITAEFHLTGGHVGFVSGTHPHDEHYYGEERAVEFLGHQIEATRVKVPLSAHHSSR